MPKSELFPSATCKQASVHVLTDPPKCLFITARVRSMTGRYCFHRCLSVNICVWGGYPSQVWMVGGVPHPRSEVGGGTLGGLDGGGYHIPGVGGTPARFGWWGVPHPWHGGYPSQIWMVVGGYPLARSGWWGGVPHSSSGWWGVPHHRSGWWGGTPSQVWMVGVPGVPPHHYWMGYPPP